MSMLTIKNGQSYITGRKMWFPNYMIVSSIIAREYYLIALAHVDLIANRSLN